MLFTGCSKDFYIKSDQSLVDLASHAQVKTHFFLIISPGFYSVQSLSRVQLFATPWTAAHQASLSFTNSRSLLKLMSTESVMPCNHLIFCHPLLLLPSIFPRIRVFSNESVFHIRWPKDWSFSFSIGPSNECSGPISFRINLFDLLAVQETLKSLLQHPSWKASIWENKMVEDSVDMEYISLHGYIRDTPSDTEVHAELQLRVDRNTWLVEKNI